MLKALAVAFGALFLSSCSHTSSPNADSSYLWLEEVEGHEAMGWVERQNVESGQALGATDRFKRSEKNALRIMEAKDKIPTGYFQRDVVVNFWRDEKNQRGILRRVSYDNFKKVVVPWETILDIDELARKENENWLYSGLNCLEPAYTHCIVSLSRGGKDASVAREFNLKTKQFEPKGFNLPEAKMDFVWVDKDTLLVATDFGTGTLTESGYPRQLKLWKRGTPLDSAKLIYEGQGTDMAVHPLRLKHKNKWQIVISRYVDFFNSEEQVFDFKTGTLTPIAKPVGAELVGFFDGDYIFELRNPWNFAGQTYAAGAVVAMASGAVGRELQAPDVQQIFTPKSNQSFSRLLELRSKIVIAVLEDVQSQVLVASKEASGKWKPPTPLELFGKGNISLSASTDSSDTFMYLYETFNQPMTLYGYKFGEGGKKLKALPDKFDVRNVVVEQKFAISKDGTKVPYFITYKKGTVFDGTHPTLQHGYGGFTLAQLPTYDAVLGKLWLERGGIYVLANIRGGGEYGPKWHQAALKENRQKAYDDFIAVSEDLIKNKVTSPQHLAIRGRSNGGLLVGAVMVQRPELYGAILCTVPLLDMLRYSQLLAGASWMSEYGDPKVPRYRRALQAYSPFHNVVADKRYAPVFFVTSTKDDRVHPGHARKMAARMKELKQDVLYYEETEGGHSATNPDFKRQAKVVAMQFEFLYQKIGDPQK